MLSRIFVLPWLLVPVVLLALALVAQRADAATFVVNDTRELPEDPNGPDGETVEGTVTLLSAMQAATRLAGPHTIELQAQQTYVFTAPTDPWYGPNALPIVTEEITIEGNGSTVERDATAVPFRLPATAPKAATAAKAKWAAAIQAKAARADPASAVPLPASTAH